MDVVRWEGTVQTGDTSLKKGLVHMIGSLMVLLSAGSNRLPLSTSPEGLKGIAFEL